MKHSFKKRCSALLLSLLMLVSVCTSIALAAESEKSTVIDGKTQLDKENVNIFKISDREFVISYPGVTEGSPLKYDASTMQWGGFKFSVTVKSADGTEKIIEQKFNDSANIDFSQLVDAAEKNGGNLPKGNIL